MRHRYLLNLRKKTKGLMRIALVLIFALLAGQSAWAQNAMVGTGFSTGWSSGCTNNDNYSYLGASVGGTYIRTTTANGTGNQYWRFGVDWSGTIGEYTITVGSDDEVFPNVTYNLDMTCTTTGAMFTNVGNTGWNYVFKTLDVGTSPTGTFVFFEIQGAVQSVSGVSQAPLDGSVSAGSAVTVTATLSGNFATGQAAYLCYSDDSFTTKSVVQMTGSGTTYTADIPAGINTSGNTIEYYVFTSGTANVAADGSNNDLYTINLNNNGGSQYNYTVNSCPTAAEPTTHASSFTADNELSTSLTLNWTNGDGAARVIVGANGLVTASPSDLVTYNADANFGDGDEIGTGNFVLYNGTGTTVDITGLTEGANYNFKIFEYNGTGCPTSGENYFVDGNEPLVVRTMAEVPKLLTGQFSNQSGTDGEKDYTTGWHFLPSTHPNAFFFYTLMTSADNAGDVFFRFKSSSGQERQPNADGDVINVNSGTKYTAFYDGGANAFKIQNANTSYRYIFRTDKDITQAVIFEIQDTYISEMTGLTQSPTNVYTTTSPSISVTLDQALPAGQGLFLIYSNDGFSTSNSVQLTGSGTSWSANIPTQADGTTVHYFVVSSGDVGSIPSADLNLYTLNRIMDTGDVPFSYSVSTAPAYETDQDGDWNTAATWLGDVVPPAGADVSIKHAVTVNGAVANDPAMLTIETGNSLSFGASGDLSVSSQIVNDGTIDMTNGGLFTIADGGTFTNNGTFTGGSGELYFPGTGTVSGTITFNDVSIAGAVDFGADAAVENILQIYGGGYLNNNSITYNEGSTLKYAGDYTVNSGDNSWFSNTASTGSAQKGVPWNVIIDATFAVKLNDDQQFDMNGNLSINGTFELGNNGGSNWGDLALRGDFVNNGTFNHNSRSVKFIGTAQQEIAGTTASTFAYIDLNNANGLLLKNEIIISNEFKFTNGKATLGTNNANIGTAAISGFGTDKYFITNDAGFVIKNVGSGEVTIPVGTPERYAPAYLTQSGTQEDLSVRVKNGIDNPTNNDDFAVNLQWTIDETDPDNNNITAKFQWNDADENPFFSNQGDVKLAYWNGTGYTKADANVAGSNPYTADASGYTNTFSGIQFVVANDFAFINNGYYTVQNGDWNTGTTWNGGTVPPTGAVCAVLHHVTLSAAATNNDFSKISIAADKSLLLDNAASALQADTILNSGVLKSSEAATVITIDERLESYSGASVNMVGGGTLSFTAGGEGVFISNGSFTSGTSKVIYNGNGSASGTLAFYDLDIAGDVDLGTNASLNGTLTLTGTGDLITNSITYTTGSTLKFDRDYSLADNKVWFRNTDANGTDQAGIPWNVNVTATKTVDISDGFYRAINGDMNINGTFDLSTTGGGDFKLRGDFVNNGTFTHNGRYVMFYGGSNQIISGSPVFQDLTIDNAANVSLNSAVTVDGALTFNNGKLILGANDLTVSGSINSADASKYVVTNGAGYLIQNVGSTEVSFPIGTMFAYNPAHLTQNGTAENLSVKVQGSIDNAVDAPTDVVNVQWTIDETNGTAEANTLVTRLQWNSTDEASGFDRTGGTSNVETRYFNGSYNPNPPNPSTVAGSGPWTATAGDDYTGNLSALPFIVANNSAFSCDCYTTGSTTNWSLATTWDCGHVPGTGETAAIIHPNINLDVNAQVKSVAITSAGSLTCNANTITLDNGGAIANTIDANFDAGTGKVVFSGAGTISTGAITFNDVDLNGAVSFGSNTTIGGTMSINAGGSINSNPPVYAVGSTLLYNQTGSVTRGSEWQYNIAEGEPGYPYNVTIDNNTTLDVDGDNNDDNLYETRRISGDLMINEGSTITLGDMGGNDAADENKVCGVYAKGDIINRGTITLSTVIGGDMMLEGNLINTNAAGDGASTINWNGRAIFFTGAAGTDQYVREISTIPFVLITRGSNVIFDNTQINKEVSITGAGIQFLTFARPSSDDPGSIDLNGHTLTSSGEGLIELNNVAGASVISGAGVGRVEVSGGNANYQGTSSGSLNFGPNVTLAINGGTMTFPETLGIVTVEGTLEVGDGATITNIPTYGDNSTLHYRKSGTFNVDVEWGPGETTEDNIPFNVTVSKGYPSGTASDLTLTQTRTALGTVTVEESAMFELAAGSGQLTTDNLTVDTNGEFRLLSPASNGAAGSLITTGTVTDNGTMIAERFVSQKKYTYLAPPNAVTNSQMFTNNTSGSFTPNFYWYDESFDAATDPDAETYAYWDSETYGFPAAWTEAHDGEGGTGQILATPGIGYAYYNETNKHFEFEGAFNTGDYNGVTITYHDNDASHASVNGYFDGWNLIANPYPSAMDWDDANWDKSYLDAAVYYWDGTYANEGNYKYYVSSGDYSDGTDVVNGGSQMIPAGQAFFVKAKPSAGATGQSLTIPNAARVHSMQNFWGKKAPEKAKSGKSADAYFRLEADINGVKDETLVRYIPEASTPFDGNYDAYKMYSRSENVPQIYTYENTFSAGFALNSVNTSELMQSVNVGMLINNQNAEECTVRLSEDKMPGSHIYFEDLKLDKVVNMRVTDHYTFEIDELGDMRDRFMVSFDQNDAPQAGTIDNYTVDFGTDIDYTIPHNTFYDADAGDELTIRLSLVSGESLPTWLHFNPAKGRFTGTAPAAGSYDISLTATDAFGEAAQTGFMLTVNAVEPEVANTEVTNVNETEADISSELISDGGTSIDNVGFCYSESPNPTISNMVEYSNLNDSDFSETLTGLSENTVYYLRSFAENSAGISYGEEVSFATLPTSVTEKGSEIFVSPNPIADGKTILSLSEEWLSKPASCTITDVSGKLLKRIDINQKRSEINFDGFAKGIYFIKVESGSKQFSQQIIVK